VFPTMKIVDKNALSKTASPKEEPLEEILSNLF